MDQVKNKIGNFSNSKTKTFSYADLDNFDKEVKPLTNENYNFADRVRQEKEYNDLLEKEATSIDAEIALSQRRIRENYTLSDSFKKLGYDQEKYTETLKEEQNIAKNISGNDLSKQYQKQSKAISNVTNTLEQDIIESKNAQKAIDNASSESLEILGYKQKSYYETIKDEQKEFHNMLSRIDNTPIENIMPKKSDVKKYYEELVEEKKSYQERLSTIETASIDGLTRDKYQDMLKQEANGQMALNLSANDYNNTLATQNELSNQRALTLVEEADGQLALNLAENDGIKSKQKSISQTSLQVAAKEALIEAQNKELLNNVKEKLVKAGVNDITGDLTISRLRDIAATEGESAAIAQETLKLLGLEGASKAASLALQALATIGNMIVMWAITKGIELAIKGLDELAHSSEHCKERVEELMSSYKSSLDTANSNAQKVEELADEYEKLSKGVNNLGENVSLTSEEYEKYNSLVNEIADMFPTLVQGYTDEGNAILNLKGNVEQLRDAYKDAQQEAYNMLIVSGDSGGNDIIKQWEDIHDTGFFAKLLDLGADDVGRGISVSDAIKQLKAIQNMTADRYREIEKITDTGSHKEIEGLTDIEKDIGYGSYLYKALGLDENVTDEEFKNVQKQAKILVQTYNAEIESALSDVETLANAYLMTNEDYAKLDEQSKNAASIMVNNLNPDIANKFSTKEDVGAYVDEIVQIISSNPDVKDAMIGLFTMDTTDMPVDDVQYWTESYINTIAKILGEDPVELKVRLGFDDDNTEQLKTKVQGFLKDEYDDKVGTLTKEDLDIASNLEIDQGTLLSWDELIARIAEAKAEASTFDTTSFETSMKAVDALNTALSAQSSQGYLKTSDIKTLLEADPNYEAALQETAAGLTLNTQKAKELTEQNLALRDAEAKAAEASAKMELEKNTKDMKELAGNTDNYQELLKAIDDGTINDVAQKIDMSAENLSKFQDLADKNDGLRDNISKWQQIQYEILGATSLLKQYNDAQSTPDENDAYAAIVKGRENADKLYENKWITQDDFTSYANLIAGYGESDIEAIQNYKKNVERLKKYMTTNKSGEVTADGAIRFLKDSIKAGGVDVTKDANGNDLYNIKSMDELAKKMNVTTEFAEDMIRALNVAGYSFPIVATEAYEYSKALKEVDYGGEDAVESVKSVIEQLQAAQDNGDDVSSSFQEVADAIAKLEEAGQDTSALKQLFALLTGQEYTPEVKFEADTSEVEQAAEEASKPETKRFTFVANGEELNAQISQLTRGQTINFNAQVNGQNKVVSATKDEYGVIHYTADIDGVETELKQVRNEKGSVYFEADTSEVDKAKKEMEKPTSSEHTTYNNTVNNTTTTATDNASGKVNDVVNKANSSKATITVDAATGVAQGKIRKFLQYIAGVKPKINIAANAANLRSSISNVLNRSWSIKVKANVSGLPSKTSEASGTLRSHASGTIVEKSGTAYNVLNMKAHASGTPVGLKSDEEAVVNELGKFCRV